MKTRLSTRVLSVLLVISLLTGLAVPVTAAPAQSGVTITQVDNSAVSVDPLQRIDGEVTPMEPYIDADVVRVSIILEKPSTIRSGFSSLDIAANEAAMTYRADLKAEQDRLVSRIEKATGSKLDVVWNLTLAANLISANVRYGQIEAIEAVPGVERVLIEQQYVAEPVEKGNAVNMATSGGQTGSALAWAEGYTGAGTRIAVIDTGSDTDHQSLDAAAFEYALAQLAAEKGVDADAYVESLDLLTAEKIAAVADELNVSIDPDAAYVNSKIPFGYNYKDADYDIVHDNDEQGEHGSHVAGIATANSYIAKDEGFVKALDEVYVQGVAPEAQLLTMKVFGKSGSPYDSDYFAAIEDAIVLGADSVNLSLGSIVPGRGTHDNDVFEQVMDDLTESGVVVAISAGNSGPWAEMAENGGYLYATDVSQHTVGQPGSFTNSLAVASVENDGMVGYYISVGGEMIVYNEDNNGGEFTNKLFREIAGEHEYIFLDGVGKAEDWAAVADVLPGKIAFCSRGETNFVEKATLAVDAGAKAVFIYNNQSGMITLDLTEYTYTNPVAALSQVQGQLIREKSTPVADASGNVLYRTGTLTVSDTIGLGQFNSEFDTMSTFSSWGVPGSLELKPEITAPGGNIYSLNGMDATGTGYEIMSGTSMASPQVAGMAALMAQYVRENDMTGKTGLSERQLIQSLLMSTATPILASEGVYYPVIQQGAGLANVHDAINADSFVTMAPGSSSGDADGKVKVELFDDPDRTGSYSASFTLHNLEDEEKTVSLSADFFTQALLSDGEFDYMDYNTAALAMDVIWTVDGSRARTATMDGCDFNGDGTVNTADGQALLDYATGVRSSLNDMERADVDADGDVDSHDAYVFLKGLSTTTATLPAKGSVDLTVRFTLTDEARTWIEESFPNGTYIQGFLFAQVEGGTAHSIPVLGFYGNWTDPGMFDVGQWTTYATGEDKRIPYIGRTRGNDFQVIYDWDPGYSYSFGGNPLVPDSVYMPERNAMNSADSLSGVSFIAIRHADQSRVVVCNETQDEVIMDVATGAVNMAYYYGALGWQNSGMTLTTNFSLKDTNENDEISMAFTLIPEYYIDSEGMVDFDALGEGATLSTSFRIDNTAPELFSASIDVMNNTMTVKASDNNYVAAVGLYNKTGTRCLAQTGAKQDIARGETAEYTFSLDKVNGKKFLLQVFDYAMNRSTYMIEMQIGEATDLPDMMAYDLVSRHWAGFDKTFEYNYKVGTPRIAYADHVYYAATIAEHYVFASTDKGELYVMPEDDLSDTTFITDLEMVLYDMAYNMADGEIYGVNEKAELVTIHKLSGEVTKVGQIGLDTNTLACDAEGTFYCNELGTGKVYSFTLDTVDEPELLMEDPYLTSVDPIMGADMGGTTGNMGMEYNPNTGMLCWNSHCEVLIGSYITYAYYYEIDPATGEYTRYADFWHEMSGLIIPVRAGNDNSWAKPTDEVMAVKLNKSEIDVIRGTSAQLSANVQPWTATDRTVTWTSADASIATVDKRGVVTGLEEGTTTIRATSNLDPAMYAECTVNVEILDVTIHGTVTDADANTSFYDWDMSSEEGWKAGAAIDHVMTSATWSDTVDAFYMMDADADWQMHKIGADGKTIASAVNTNEIPLWDMTYNPYFTEAHGLEQVSSIYYYYLLSPKEPMNMDAVGFNLGDLADYLVGITSAGYEQMADEDGVLHDTEHLILLDNDGYVWDFWIYDREGGGMDALYAISKSNLTCEFPGDDTMDNMYTSLMLGEDGNLYLSAFNGSTNEIWHMSYDEDLGQYLAVQLGTMGADVCPASITSVTVNGEAGTAAHPAPTGTMSAGPISENELKAAASKARFTVSAEELAYKTNAGTEEEPTPFVIGDNTVTAPKTGYFFSYTAASDGTATVFSEGTDWRATVYINGELSGNSIHNPKYDGSEITRDLVAGDTLVFKIIPYSGWSAVEKEITVSFAYSGEGGTVDPDPTDPTDPVDPDPTDPVDPDPSEDEIPALVLGENALTSGAVYEYVVPADGRMEFSVGSVYNSAGSKQYSWYNGSKLQILIDGKAMTSSSAKFNVTAGEIIPVQIVSLDGDTYTADMTLKEIAAAETLSLGENAVSQDLEYVYTAEQDGTLYFSVVELLYNGSPVTESALGSSVQMTISGASVSSFNKSYEVAAGDELALILKDYSWDGSGVASATVSLSYEGFYEQPEGSLANPVELLYADCPTSTIEIAAGGAVWYQLEGDPGDYMTPANYPFKGKTLLVTGEGAYVVVDGTRYDAENGVVRIEMNEQTLIQIGNDGSAAATFDISVEIPEGHVDNPQDLTEGENKVTLPSYGTHYYDFTATAEGTATVTLSGKNWKFSLTHFAADGSQISTRDCYAKNGDADTVELAMNAGERIVVMVGTSQGYSQPGGDVTVHFHFEPAEAPCAHENTEIRGAAEATCTQSGYTGDTWCLDCGEKIADGTVIPALGHDYVDGVCTRCGCTDPDYKPDNSVTVEIKNEIAATNGVVLVEWDRAKLTLTDIVINADYTSVLNGEGSVTFGYVSLNGIPAGKSVAKLTFEAVDPADADVSVKVRELNNGDQRVNPFVDIPEGSYCYDPVMWAVDNGITNGMDATHFGPTIECNRAQAVTFLWRAKGCPEPKTTENPFVDVKASDFCYKAVLWAAENGITTGTDDTHFAPAKTCNRAEIVIFLWRAEGQPAPAGENPFHDVPSGSFYEDAVVWAYEMGIANGLTDTAFGPGVVCNRAQIVTFLYRAYA